VASLSGDGSLLVYATRSGIAVLPTGAADGSLASRSRIVAPDREFGPGTLANHSRLAPNNTLYFATHHSNNGWQLRAYNLTTGRTRLLKALPGSPLGIVSDPSGRYLLVRYTLNTVPARHPDAPAARLVRLDTATGKIIRLAAHASGVDQFTGEVVLAW
jgi:hypothetical protein